MVRKAIKEFEDTENQMIQDGCVACDMQFLGVEGDLHLHHHQLCEVEAKKAFAKLYGKIRSNLVIKNIVRFRKSPVLVPY